MNLIRSIVLILFTLSASAFGQTRVDGLISNGAVSVGSKAAADSNSMLDVHSTTKYVLIPRMTTTQMNAISGPTTSGLIFNTSTGFYTGYSGAAWIPLVDISTAQTLTNKSMSGSSNTFTNIPFTGLASLTSGNILVGNGSNVPTSVAMSGDATLANTGAITFGTVNSNVGSFTAANITVNAKGLVTAAANGSGGGGLTNPTSSIICNTGTGVGSTNATTRIYTNCATIGSDFTYATSAANGDTFTANFTGVATIDYCEISSGGADYFCLSKNGTALATTCISITPAQGRIAIGSYLSTLPECISRTINLVPTDIIRGQATGNYQNGNAATIFSIVRVN